MAFSNGYIFGFAATVCVACSLVLSVTATSLKEVQDLNRERDLKSNILGALGLGEGLRGEAIDKTWDERVEVAFIKPDGARITEADTAALDQDGDGDVDLDDVTLALLAVKGTDATPAVLAVYQRMDDGKPVLYGIPVSGKGLWGPVSGYIVADPSGSEVKGVTFAAPKETPGLGAEIMSEPFQQQWIGKRLVKDGKPAPIRVAKGSAAATHPDELDHWVDGVSGATITCRGVTAMVEQGIAFYEPFLSRLQKGG